MRLVGMILAASLLAIPAPVGARAEPIRVLAAGSLRPALTEILSAWRGAGGGESVLVTGPSGLLRARIAGGDRVDLFASANLEHPRAVAAGRPVVPFARNHLCALARPGLDVTTETLLDRMLEPAVRLGTSTPVADPSGDYAFAAFARAEALRPGARVALEAKALTLTGGPDSPAPPPGRNAYAHLLETGAADLFLTYCTGARDAVADLPAARIVVLPETLAVAADYGLVVLGAYPPSSGLASFILGEAGQAILGARGFAAPSPNIQDPAR